MEGVSGGARPSVDEYIAETLVGLWVAGTDSGRNKKAHDGEESAVEEKVEEGRPCALVTGASRGIGRGIVLALANEGYDIVGNATSHDPENTDGGLAEVGLRCREAGVGFVPAVGDIADLAVHDGIVATALDRFGRLDLLVNNAGVAPLDRVDFLEVTPESYDRVMGINLRGTFFLTQRAAREMVSMAAEGKLLRPAIVFITSVSADTSSPTRAEYGVSKAGMSHLARVCAHRLSQEGIDVFEVRPGIIRTDMTKRVRARYDTLIAEGFVPQGRWGTPEDVGLTVAALARGDFPYSTGGVFEVSGGMNIKRF
ncbi:MAG: 3-ketoacyl-ACP reductase [Gemmatimonadota bacterium]